MAVLQQAPETFGINATRWCLTHLRKALPWLSTYSLPGIWLALGRLGLGRKRGRLSVHSPDRQYQEKLCRIQQVRQVAHRYPQRVVMVYGDEFSLYRQPTLGPVYALKGEEPRARLSWKANTRQRISGALNPLTGQVTFTQGYKMGVKGLQGFLQELRSTYPNQILVLVWDNWTVHHHPRVLEEAQRLKIHLLWLPTYAPWTNPIEKLWRWVKGTLLHHHRKADRWEELKAQVAQFLGQFKQGSPELLRYVGLLPY